MGRHLPAPAHYLIWTGRPSSFGRRSVGCIFRCRVDLVGTVEVAGGPAMDAMPARGYPIVGQFDFHDPAAVRADCIHRFLLHLSGIDITSAGRRGSFEFIPISNMLASVIDPCRDRRHDPWPVSGSLTCSPDCTSANRTPAMGHASCHGTGLSQTPAYC